MANFEKMLHSFLSIACAATIFTSYISRFCLSEAKNSTGFSFDLIHRDSPMSLLYDPSLTPSQRLANALQRAFNRMNYFANLSHKSHSGSTYILSDDGEYLMEISIGTPGFRVPAIVDTGSDLIWTQCQPCVECFKQKTPIFNPSKSSSYKRISCQANACNGVEGSFCDEKSKSCSYVASYGDGSSSRGEIATDTITLGTAATGIVSLPNTIFGCGHENGGTFGSSSGIVGLGSAKVSLVSQMGSSIHGQFSYCLVPFSDTTKHSKINFGDNASVSGTGVVRTRLVLKSFRTYYYLTLKGISVGRKRLEISYDKKNISASSKVAEEGNIIIDSGTTLTLLPSSLYSQLESTLRHQINKTTVSDPEQLFRLCYSSLKDAEIPKVTIHFEGADVKLKAYNIFVKTSNVSLCLGFAPVDGIAIYGNIAQMNFLVGYDLKKKTVSFKATDCTKD